MLTGKHPLDQNTLFKPMEVLSAKDRQTVVNGETISFKKGDKVKLHITHIYQLVDGEYMYCLTLQINEGKLKFDRSVMHTLDLMYELIQLGNDTCCENPKPYTAIRHESGERLEKCKNCNTYLS